MTVAGALAAAADDRCTNTGSSTDLLYRYSRSSNASYMNDAKNNVIRTKELLRNRERPGW